jgi:hypothetical protein
MKKISLILLVLWLALIQAFPSDLAEFLKHQPSIQSVEVIPGNSFFRETLQVFIKQPVDHNNPSAGTFLQRVFIAELDPASPVVFVTEGYGADYASNPRYLNELSPLLKANQIVLEHRYFGKSWPDPVNWDYLTVANAAGDHHAVVQLLKPFFTGKWVNTGISKGGQTALLHRVFYPADVDLTISYVAPMNFAVEDGRHEPWIAKVSGTKPDRAKVLAFQKEVLRRRDKLMPLFEDFIKKNKYTFRVGIPEIYDYTVLEFSFSFWQWGNKPAEIPALSSSDEMIFNFWMKVSSPDYFAIEKFSGTGSFDVQAAKELGYYGYDTKPFGKLLTIKSAKGYLPRLFLPDDIRPSFDKASALMSQKFLDSTTLPMIFIYGKNDPWCASGVVVPENSSVLKIVQKGGSHRTRISNLDEANKKLVMEKINQTIPLPSQK